MGTTMDIDATWQTLLLVALEAIAYARVRVLRNCVRIVHCALIMDGRRVRADSLDVWLTDCLAASAYACTRWRARTPGARANCFDITTSRRTTDFIRLLLVTAVLSDQDY